MADVITPPCPECGGRSIRMIGSCLYANGTRYRRYGCRGCGHRWSHHDGPRPEMRPRRYLLPCPHCRSDDTRVIGCTPRCAGPSRRRYGCRACGYRWTSGDPPLSRDAMTSCIGECTARVLEVRHSKTTGATRRRYGCDSCGRRWTAYDGQQPSSGANPRRPADPPCSCPQAHARVVCSEHRHAERYVRWVCLACDVRWSEVGGVRLARPASAAKPSKPARPSATCLSCRQWGPGCGLGIPEAELDGPRFAAECAAFLAS